MKMRQNAAKKTEIVFFPYKASMWDSLESIWLAAKDDPACKCFVVPIPYQNRDKDGNITEEFYEGNDFPAYVPITHYSEYSLKDSKPDIAYLHNFYDDSNNLTSVVPDYFTYNVKKHCGCVVMVPYTVFHNVPFDLVTLQMSSFVCDKYIVQSKMIADKYVSDIENHCTAKNYPFIKEYWERKFAAIGSPKFDSAINKKADDFEIPDKWREVLYSDGVKKPCLLYYTSLYTLTAADDNLVNKSPEHFFTKLTENVEFFGKRNDTAVMWRPHPLTEITIKNKVPQFLDTYKKAIERFCSFPNTIFDTTPDFSRAIALCDGVYGANESGMVLLGAARKPSLIQTYQPRNDLSSSEFKYEIFDNAAFDGKYYYFTLMCFNALFRMDQDTLKAEFLGRFPALGDNFRNFYQGWAVGDKIYFFGRAEFIGVYTKSIGLLETISYTDILGERINDFKTYGMRFSNMIIWQNAIWLVPNKFPSLVRYDLGTKKTTFYDEPFREIEALRKNPSRGCVQWGYAHKDRIVMALPSAEAICTFVPDENGGQTTIIKAELGCDGYFLFCADVANNAVYFAPIKGAEFIVKYNFTDETLIKIPFLTETIDKEYFLQRAINLPDKIKFVTGDGRAFELDKTSETITETEPDKLQNILFDTADEETKRIRPYYRKTKLGVWNNWANKRYLWLDIDEKRLKMMINNEIIEKPLDEVYKYAYLKLFNTPTFAQTYFLQSDNPAMKLRSEMFDTLAYDGKYYYISLMCFNALFRIDQATLKAEFLGQFPGPGDNFRNFYQGWGLGDKIYFFGRTEFIGVYTKSSGLLETISYNDILGDRKDDFKTYGLRFSNMIIWQNAIWLVPNKFPSLVRYDLGTKKTTFYNEPFREIEALRKNPNRGCVQWGYAHKDRIVMACPSAEAFCIFKPNENGGETSIVKMEFGCDGYFLFCADVAKDTAYFAPVKGAEYIVKYNFTDETLKKIPFISDNIECEWFAQRAVNQTDKISFVSKDGRAFVLDKASDTISETEPDLLQTDSLETADEDTVKSRPDYWRHSKTAGWNNFQSKQILRIDVDEKKIKLYSDNQIKDLPLDDVFADVYDSFQENITPGKIGDAIVDKYGFDTFKNFFEPFKFKGEQNNNCKADLNFLCDLLHLDLKKYPLDPMTSTQYKYNQLDADEFGGKAGIKIHRHVISSIKSGEIKLLREYDLIDCNLI
jgi:hypothetical protein